MSKKKSFLLYEDMGDPIGELTDEQAGQVFKAIFQYVRGQGVAVDGMAKVAFNFIRVTLDRDRAAYEARCVKNAENGNKGGRPAKKPKADKTDLFEKFWAAYPRKSAKAEARKAFGKISEKKLTEEILPDLEKRKLSDQWKEKNGAFIPYPATYLRGERWNDEMQRTTKKRDFQERTVTDDDFKDLFIPL